MLLWSEDRASMMGTFWPWWVELLEIFTCLFRSNVDPNQYHFGDPDPAPCSKNLVRIMGNSHKNRQKSSEKNIFEDRNHAFVKHT